MAARIDFEIIYSIKGRPLIAIDRFKFSYHKVLTNNVQRYKCCKNSCSAFIKLPAALNEVIESQLHHNHDAEDEQTYNRKKLSNNLKRKATEDICTRPSKLVSQNLRVDDISTLTTRDVRLTCRSIRRARRSAYPKLPKTKEEFHTALDEQIVTNRGENFVMCNDRNTNIIMFSTASNLRFLVTLIAIFIDGTFFSCPKPFTQLFTIHGYNGYSSSPLVFFLLPDKSASSYASAFSMLLAKCAELNLRFDPRFLYADFEKAIHKGAMEVFPEIVIRGCRFHLGQSWFRNFTSNGLKKEYEDMESPIGQWLKLLFGLPFLDPAEVADCFVDDLLAIMPQDNRLDDVVLYLLLNYILPSATFPPTIWASFEASIRRTTNNCEAFHSKFNENFRTNPNFFVFKTALLDVQHDVYIKLRSNSAQSQVSAVKEATLRDAMLRYSVGDISRLQYIRLVSRKFLPRMT